MLNVEAFAPATTSATSAPSVPPSPTSSMQPTMDWKDIVLGPLAHDVPSNPLLAELFDGWSRRKSHELKHHFDYGCVRELVGLLDRLAAKDPRRFVRWEAIKVAMKRCRRREGKNKGKRYSARTIQRSFQALRDSGIIRKTKDCWGKGYIVASHEDITRPTPDGWCKLLVDFNSRWARINGRKESKE